MMGVNQVSERYYPQGLVKAYFNYCKASALTPSANGLDSFAKEVQGDSHINGIPTFLTLEQVFATEESK
jgi:hypothetical protein